MVDIDLATSSSSKLRKNSHELYWGDLDQGKFLGLLAASSLVLRTCCHPLGLIKTRLQTERKGGCTTLQMAQQVWRKEGCRRGFYRGFPIGLCSLLFEPIFTATLEKTRTVLSHNQPGQIHRSHWDIMTTALSTCAATLVYQTFTVPIDVTTQRIMITRAHEGSRVIDVIRDIYYKSGDGIRGFYKGYVVSLSISLPFNSLMWNIYWRVQIQLERLFALQHQALVAPLSATVASLLTSLLTQPIDVLKTRLQVAPQRQSLTKTSRILLAEHGLKGFFSGAVPRACAIVPYSVIMMSLYEVIKRASVRPI